MDPALRLLKSLAKNTEVQPQAVMLHKLFTSTFEAGAERQIKFTISTPNIDRDNDRVALDGWVLDAFMKNPVVLWGHNASALPVGKCVAIGVEDNALKAMVEFVPADMPEVGPRAEAILRMCQTGFLSATSVGFRPLEFEWSKDRADDDDWWPPIDFIRQELMEFSICSIPANAEALIDPAYRLLTPTQVNEPMEGLAPPPEQVSQAVDTANHQRHRRALLRTLI